MVYKKSDHSFVGPIIAGLIYVVCILLYVEICIIIWNVGAGRIISYTGYCEDINSIEYRMGSLGKNEHYYLYLDNGSVISFSDTLLKNEELSESILCEELSEPQTFCYTYGMFPNNHLVSIENDESVLISRATSKQTFESKARIYLLFANVAALFVLLFGIIPAFIRSRWWNKAKQKLHSFGRKIRKCIRK